MTEADWNASTDLAAMLEAFTIGRGDAFPEPFRRVTDRQLRLFACACVRQVWDGTPCERCGGVVTTWAGKQHGTGKTGRLANPRSRRAVEVAEAFAEGWATFAVGAFTVGSLMHLLADYRRFTRKDQP
jgi:hypothetical protein